MTDVNPPTSAPHVVYLIHNDAYADTRVLKNAATAAKAGLRVTLIAGSPDNRRYESWLGTARVIRVPVARSFRRRDHWNRIRQALRSPVSALGYWDTDRGRDAALRARLALLDLASKRGEEALLVERGETRSPSAPLAATRKVTRRIHRDVLRGRSAVVRARRRLALGWVLHPPTRETAAERMTEYDVGSIKWVTWRRNLPWLRDLEIAFAPVLDQLDAEIIHVHDVYLLGTAAHSAFRARAKGRTVGLVYDAREYVAGLAIQDPVEVCASADHEAEFIRFYDEVLAVSERIAEALYRKFDLPRRPDVSYNVPLRPRADAEDAPSVRLAAGLGPDDKIIVYSGGLHESRGVHTLVDAVATLTEVHLVLVARSRRMRYVRLLRERMRELGAEDRFHVVDFVAPDDVVIYLSSADVAVHSLVAGPLNHEWAMPNKLFEYLHAGLPIVVSDCRCMKEFVESTGTGLAYRSEDAVDLARALRAVLHDPQLFRNPVHRKELVEGEYSWQRQAERILACYEGLLSGRWTAPQGADLEPERLAEYPITLDV
jgi:glycosyltransferase involved in cell wall biosynthesis